MRSLARDGWEFPRDQAGVWTSLFRGPPGRFPFKLYLSPNPSELTLVARRALPVLSAAGARAIKVAASLATLLRPDRCVAYFDSVDALHAAGRELSLRLHDIVPLGVPFAGPIDRRGLLSWGFDTWRPDSSGRSWRQHVTDHLALAIHRARRRRRPPIQTALGELESAGIDPASFAPLRSFVELQARGSDSR